MLTAQPHGIQKEQPKLFEDQTSMLDEEMRKKTANAMSTIAARVVLNSSLSRQGFKFVKFNYCRPRNNMFKLHRVYATVKTHNGYLVNLALFCDKGLYARSNDVYTKPSSMEDDLSWTDGVLKFCQTGNVFINATSIVGGGKLLPLFNRGDTAESICIKADLLAYEAK